MPLCFDQVVHPLLHKKELEKHLVKRLGERLAVKYYLLLYGTTTNCIEGIAAPAICDRGYSRDHRPNCMQVNIALVVTERGRLLGHELFGGIRADVTTVEDIISAIEERYGQFDCFGR